jgi:hypothetical protein
MMKKISISLNIVLIVILIVFYQYHKEEMILNTAIFDSKSSIYLYELEQNKTQILKTSLVTDVIFLINGYDKNIYKSSSSIKRTLCKDVPNYHRKSIEKYLEGNFYQTNEGKIYKDKTLKNLKLIKSELCLDFKNKD